MIQKHIDSFRKANVPLCHSPFDGYPRSPIESSHSPSLLKFRPRKKSECNCCKTLLSSKMQSCASRLSSVASNDRRRLDHGAASLGVLPATEQGAIIAVSGSHRLRSLSKGDRQKATRKERGRRRVCRSGVTRTHRDCRGTRNYYYVSKNQGVSWWHGKDTHTNCPLPYQSPHASLQTVT